MARLSMKGPSTVAEITALLKERIPECGLSCELVDSASRPGAELLVFEKHYYRAGNALSLTIMVTSSDGLVIVDAVGAGAKSGLFDFAWGAEEDFASEANNVLAPLGFVVFDRSSEFTEPWQPEEPPEPMDINELMSKGKEAARSEKQAAEDADWHEVKADEPERVKLGREEKKGLFGRRRKKPDWEY